MSVPFAVILLTLDKFRLLMLISAAEFDKVDTTTVDAVIVSTFDILLLFISNAVPTVENADVVRVLVGVRVMLPTLDKSFPFRVIPTAVPVVDIPLAYKIPDIFAFPLTSSA